MKIEFELTDDQVNAIAKEVARRLDKTPKQPMTVAQFAQATNQSPASIYRLIESGHIATVPHLHKKLIPARQLNHYL